MASSLVTAYEQLLINNVSTVTTVESTIRNVTWFLPGRFNDADIASEGLYALLSVVSSFHDALLSKRIPESLSLPPHPFSPASTQAGPSSGPIGAPTPRVTPLLPPASEHTRYTRYWSEKSPTYKRASRALVTTTYVELLLEMVAKKRGSDRTRWKVVFGVEAFKTMLRLILLAITRRPVLYPPTPQREYDVGLIPQDQMKQRQAGELVVVEEKVTEIDPNHQRPALPALGSRAPLRTHLYPLVSALPESYQAHATTLVPEFRNGSEVAAEVISASAVLLQVVLLIKASRAPNAPAYRRASLPTLSRALPPFLVPFLLQILARRLRAPAGDSTLLADHYAQLDRRMASRFFLQGPMWIGWTRPKVVSFVRGLERIPLIGLAGELLSGYLPLVDDYFYTVT